MDPSAPSRFDRWLSHPRAPRAIALLALILALPSIAIGFYADDYAFFVFLAKIFPRSPPWYDLYRFVPGGAADNQGLIERGFLPWWSHPEVKLHLVRPLASALLAAERAIFAEAPLGYHIVSIAGYVALCAAVGRLFHKRIPGPTGALALLLFAINETHLLSFGWISCQHLLLGSVPVVLGLHAYLRYREERWRPGLLLGPLGLTLGLFGGEAALGGVAYWVTYHLAGPAPADERHGFQRRLTASLPALGIAAYFAFYRAVGGGSAHSGGYIEPLSDPVGFARAVAVRLPILLGNGILGVPAELSGAFSPGPLVAVGVLATAGLALLYRACQPAIPEVERAALRWLVPGALLSILPGLGGFPGGRTLLLPSIGLSALFAALIRHGLRRADAAGEGLAARALRYLGAGVLVLVHLVVAPLAMTGGSLANAAIARRIESIGRTAEIGPPAHKRVFIAAASDMMAATYPWMVISLDDPEAVSCWSVLSMAKAPHRITRSGPSSFLLAPLGRPMLLGGFEVLYRAPGTPMRVGDEVRQCGATIRVTAIEDGNPAQIEVDLGAPLEDAGLALLTWRDGGLRKMTLGAVGEAVEIPWSPGPMGMF